MEQKKESKIKKYRNFIKSHEVWYFVDDSFNQVHIKKAYRVELDDGVYWIHFAYGEAVHNLTAKQEKLLFPTMAEAKAKAEQMRKENAERRTKERKEEKEKFNEVTKYLENFRVWDIVNYNSQEIKPEYKSFADAIEYLYSRLPDKRKRDKDVYIKLLENYIKHGTIQTQGLSFTKEQVVTLKYGEYSGVRVELTNGTTINPANEKVIALIKLVFGENVTDWLWNDAEVPQDGNDEINEK